ncbi:GFA family protein [Actibacterium sp. 188UL27-1]|uniref:GFA family protein n=1 Tax=Actibacterium sp. 188UL27-1 TaxID=2786961 RepID=UPI0019598AB2|nr:GFA family protein [Actibacterium sp. 188UL27-1]
MKSFEGGCLCGHIRFSVAGPLPVAHTCSCLICQRHTGSLTAIWLEVPADAVTWAGPGGSPSVFRSSEMSCRAFCPICGSSIGAIDDAPVIALLTGTFDKPHLKALKPAKHSYKGARPKWWRPEIDP